MNHELTFETGACPLASLLPTFCFCKETMQVATMSPLPKADSSPPFYPTTDIYQMEGHKLDPGCHCGMCMRARQRKRDTEGRVRRPMNAFMVWAKLARRQLACLHPGTHNAELSRMLGAHWKSMSELEKRPFKDQADEIRAAHQRMNPEYRCSYRPGRRDKKKPPREYRRQMSRGGNNQSIPAADAVLSAPLLNQQQFFFPHTPATPFSPDNVFTTNPFEQFSTQQAPVTCNVMERADEDIHEGLVLSYLPAHFQLNRDEFDCYVPHQQAPNSAPAYYNPITPPYDEPFLLPSSFQPAYVSARPSCDYSETASPFDLEDFDFDDSF